MEEQNNNFQRPIDQDVSAARQVMRSRFSYVTKARANIWLTTGVTLFVLGLIGGGFVVFGGNPNAGSQGQAAELADRLSNRGADHVVSPNDNSVYIDGPSQVEMGQSNSYIFTTSNLTSTVRYSVDWGDGNPVEYVQSGTPSTPASASHSYAQVGTFTMSVRLAPAGASAAEPTTLEVHVGNAAAAGNLVLVSLDASTPASQTLAANSANATFAVIKMSTQADVTIRSLTIVYQGQPINVGAVKIYVDNTLVGTGSFAQGGVVPRIVIALGAGVTIPAGSSTLFTIKADIVPAPSGGDVALGVESASTNPSSTLSDNLPVYGNAMTVRAGRQIRIDGGPNVQP